MFYFYPFFWISYSSWTVVPSPTSSIKHGCHLIELRPWSSSWHGNQTLVTFQWLIQFHIWLRIVRILANTTTRKRYIYIYSYMYIYIYVYTYTHQSKGILTTAQLHKIVHLFLSSRTGKRQQCRRTGRRSQLHSSVRPWRRGRFATPKFGPAWTHVSQLW